MANASALADLPEKACDQARESLDIALATGSSQTSKDVWRFTDRAIKRWPTMPRPADSLTCSDHSTTSEGVTAAVFSMATDAAPGRPNEDFVLVTPELAVVVDGAGIPFGGCIHGVAWYSRQLAAQTLAALSVDPRITLTEGLAQGIEATAHLHRGTCDLSSETTPCAAVGILRIGTETVDTLTLSDCVVVVETADGPHVTCDLAIEELAGTEPETLAGLTIGSAAHKAALARLVEKQTATRNREDGWWVAASDPQAAHHALTNSYARTDVRRAAAFTDGATRPVDQMGLYRWPEYLDLLDKLGPIGLIGHVRSIEKADPDGVEHPRTKTHDDASAAQAIGLTQQSQ